jgi:hypothetical protein
MTRIPRLEVGDIAVMRKPHACGSSEWEIIRVGADIGLRCLGCRRRVLLERPYFNTRVKEIRPASL